MSTPVFKAPRYQTVATVHLLQTGLDADSTPTLAELQTTLDFSILGQPPATVVQNTTVPANTQISAGGLLLSSLNRITWFAPTTFRFRVVERDTNPVGPDLSILDRKYDFGTTENWIDNEWHTVPGVPATVQGYSVILKFKAGPI